MPHRQRRIRVCARMSELRIQETRRPDPPGPEPAAEGDIGDPAATPKSARRRKKLPGARGMSPPYGEPKPSKTQ